MSESEIITKEAITDSLTRLTNAQEVCLENTIKVLVSVKESKKISESNFRALTNAWKELDAIRESFFLNLLNSLKRGDMIRN